MNNIPFSTDHQEYQQKLLSADWQAKRQEILNRDFHKCRNCANEKNLQIHHRQYHYKENEAGMIDPWQYENKYLVTLCATCHEAGHKQYTIKSFQL